MKKLILLIFMLFTSPAWSAGPFYVNGSGTDSAGTAGTSDATAFRTLSYALTRISAGEDVYLKCGGTWTSTSSTGYYTIPVSGVNAGNNTIIGAYYMVGSTETVGVPAGGQKPILNGNAIAPSAGYTGLINFNADRSYITIQDLDIYNSGAFGVNLGTYNFDHITIQRCTIRTAWGSGIVINNYGTGGKASTNITIDNNDVSYVGRICQTSCNSWPCGIVATNPGVNGVVISNNTVHNIYGEGIDALNSAQHVDIYQNTIYSTRSHAIYTGVGAHDLEIYKNLMYGTTNSAFWNNLSTGGRLNGYSTLDESWSSPLTKNENINFYNNIIVGAGRGVYIGAGGTAGGTSAYLNNKVYNNTVIDTKGLAPESTNFRIGGTSATPYEATSYFRNNISLCVSSNCNHYSGLSSVPNIEWDHNLWYGNTVPAAGTEPRGTGDVTDAPQLIKMTGFQDLADGGLVMGDVKFSSGSSPGVDAGADTSAIVTTDAWGVTRPVNTVVDIGVHEWPVIEDSPYCGDKECIAPETCGDEDAGNECLTDCGACESGSFSCTDVSLLWNMEAADTIQYTLGADTAFSLNSDAAIHADANKAGTNGLKCATSNDNAQLTLADGLVVSRLEGSVAFWMKYNTAIPSDNATLWYAGTSGSSIYITAVAGGDLKLTIYNGSYVSLQTTSAGLTTGAWYFVIARWDHANNDRFIGVYTDAGVLIKSAENLTTSWTAPPSEFTNMYLGNTNTASTFNVYYDYLLGISKQYDTDWLSADTEAMPDCSGEDPVALALTEIAVPVVPLSGQPTWVFNSTLAGTLTMVGPCKTATTDVVGGNNSLTFTTMGKGSYTDCKASVVSGEETVVLSVSPFTVDYWTLGNFGSGGVTITPSATGAMTLYFGGALPE